MRVEFELASFEVAVQCFSHGDFLCKTFQVLSVLPVSPDIFKNSSLFLWDSDYLNFHWHWLIHCILQHINLCRLINAKSCLEIHILNIYNL